MEVTGKAATRKIILSGKHVVVHGSTDVASHIGLCISVTLCFPSHAEDDGNLKLQLADLALEFSWPIAQVQGHLGESDVVNCSKPSSPNSCLSSSQALVGQQNIPEAKIGPGSGVEAFLWLYTCIQGYKPATVTVTSELPLGSGLGSSTTYCVARSIMSTSCFIQWCKFRCEPARVAGF